jgi:hypothetical protein
MIFVVDELAPEQVFHRISLVSLRIIISLWLSIHPSPLSDVCDDPNKAISVFKLRKPFLIQDLSDCRVQ